ncbi:MAG: GSCFA domain-containing protein, partial [Bacteroidales bacterium]|nr:GSCFA domain-containing protein [Bacteroidales bacterium]
VVYNPMSVKKSLDILISSRKYSSNDLNYHNDLWYSWAHHSSFSGVDKEQVLQAINQKIAASSEFLKNAGYLFLSFGTARIYRLIRTGNIVCNCHKIPAKEFAQELLQVDEIVQAYEELIHSLKAFNPRLRIIFTVSPVRHWKDGARGNQVSKSILHLAVQQLIEKLPEETEYFPSYELLIDDLRDYRFFAEDLLHPNELGIQYIWEKFSEQYFDPETMKQISGIQEIIRAAGHRITNRNSESSKDFIKKQKEKLRKLMEEMPYLNWEDLKKVF